MNWENFVAQRYMAARRKQVFTLFATVIAVSGIALGVASLVVTLSIMNGFQYDIKEKILGLQAHLVVMGIGQNGLQNNLGIKEKIITTPRIISCSPFIYGQVLARAGTVTQGMIIRGISVAEESNVTNIYKQIRKGKWESLQSFESNIVLGKELAKSLGVGLNEELILISPGRMDMPFDFFPQMKKFMVTGIFESGMYEYDNTLAYVSLTNAQQLMGLGDRITGFSVKTKDVYNADKVARELQNRLGANYWVKSWMYLNRNLFSALKLEKIMMAIVLVLIVLVAAFNILSTLMLMTMEKVKDIAILQAIGARRKSIARIFFYEGITIGVLGVVIGEILGIGLAKFLQYSGIIKLPADVYYIHTLPVRISGVDLIFIAGSALVISLVSTLYPARKASLVNPSEALRYE